MASRRPQITVNNVIVLIKIIVKTTFSMYVYGKTDVVP